MSAIKAHAWLVKFHELSLRDSSTCKRLVITCSVSQPLYRLATWLAGAESSLPFVFC